MKRGWRHDIRSLMTVVRVPLRLRIKTSRKRRVKGVRLRSEKQRFEQEESSLFERTTRILGVEDVVLDLLRSSVFRYY